jgi:nucleobase:cation symporter-1, NCS1 family
MLQDDTRTTRTPRTGMGLIEVRSIDYVPDAERHGKVRDQFTLWFGACMTVLGVVLGAIAVSIVGSFLWAVVAFAIGTVLGLLLVGFHAMQGPRLGVPQMIQSRAQFGFYGALLVLACSIVLDFGYLAAQLVVQGEALNVLVPRVSVPVWILVVSVPVAIIALYGYDWVHRWQRWMSLVLGITFIVILIQTLAHGSLPHSARGLHFPSFALFMAVVALSATNMLSWAPYVSDYSRYLPKSVSPTKAFWAVMLGNAIPTIFLAAVGAYLGSLLPKIAAANTPLAIKDVAGAWVLPIMAISLIGSDVLNVYTGMLAIASIASCVRDVRNRLSTRIVGAALILAAGIVAAILGYNSFVAGITEFLAVLLFVFIPWTAINLTDFYIVRRGDYDVPSFFTARGRYGGWTWRGLIPYLIAIAAEVPFVDQQFYTGPLVRSLGGVDISWIVGGVVAFVLYMIAVRIPGKPATERPKPDEPAEPRLSGAV